jgi:hypothetical protein
MALDRRELSGATPRIGWLSGLLLVAAVQTNGGKKLRRKFGWGCHPTPVLPVRCSLALILTALAPWTVTVGCLALSLAFLVPLALVLALSALVAPVLAPLVLACRSWPGWSWSWLSCHCWFPGLWSWLGRSWLRWPWLCWTWLR